MHGHTRLYEGVEDGIVHRSSIVLMEQETISSYDCGVLPEFD